MIQVAVAREVAIPTPPYSRHFEAPCWWPEWISQVLAEPTPAPAPACPARAVARARVAVACPSGARGAALTPEGAYPAAAAALRGALREAREAAAAADPRSDGWADDWAATVAEHQVHLARRAVRALLDAAAATGPGSRLEWCLCSESTTPG